MKRILFFALLFIAGNCFSQKLLNRTRRITPNVTEKYSYTIGTDREIKQGLYQAMYNKKNALASGKYVDDKKVGLWHFFNRKGQLIQNYNYDTHTLQYEIPDGDAASSTSFQYAFDAELKATDKLTKPIRTGGQYYGYIPYLTTFKLPRDIISQDAPEYDVALELLISPGGRLADFKIHMSSEWEDDRVITVNINRMKDEDKEFFPATLNGEAVSSRIVIQCYITPQQSLDIF